jgi:hypothetical protein
VVPASRAVPGFPRLLVPLERPGPRAVRVYCAEPDSRRRRDLRAVRAALVLPAVPDAHDCRRRRNERPHAAPRTRGQLRILVFPHRLRIHANRREQPSERARRDPEPLGQASRLARSRRAQTLVPSYRQSGPQPGGSAEGCGACPSLGSSGRAPADRGGLPRPEPGGRSAAGTGVPGSGRR